MNESTPAMANCSMDKEFDPSLAAEIVKENREKDGARLLFSCAGKYPAEELRVAAATLDARKRIRTRLKEWEACEELLFPDALCLEQCSSEATARYKAGILKTFLEEHTEGPLESWSGADLTGGLGIDCYYISRNFARYDYFERKANLCRAGEWNFQALRAENIEVHHSETSRESLETLIRSGHRYTSVFLDPARRDARQERVFGISDCEPDVLGLKDLLFELADVVMLKLSPMIDIKDCIAKLENVMAIYIVSVRNECKELLCLLKKGERKEAGTIPVIAAMIDADESLREYRMTFQEEEEAEAAYFSGEDFKGKYLYEPDKAVLKAGAFKKVATDFRLLKLDRNIHLYLSENAPETSSAFPGKIYRIDEVFGMDRKSIKAIRSSYPCAEIITKNLPLGSEGLRRKIGIKDGPAVHLFALGFPGRNLILATSRI